MSRFLPYHLNLEAGKTIQSPELSQGVSQYLPCPVLLTQANTGEGPESIRQLDSYIQMLSLGVYAFQGGDSLFFFLSSLEVTFMQELSPGATPCT